MVGSEHVQTLRFFNLSQDAGFEVSAEEETHLLGCEDCRKALTTFALLFRPSPSVSRPLMTAERSQLKKFIQGGLFMAGSQEHVKPLNLFDLSRDSGSVLTEEEKKHLRECEQCQHVLAVFVASSTSKHTRTNPPRRKIS